jgi:hypothetical protein
MTSKLELRRFVLLNSTGRVVELTRTRRMAVARFAQRKDTIILHDRDFRRAEEYMTRCRWSVAPAIVTIAWEHDQK